MTNPGSRSQRAADGGDPGGYEYREKTMTHTAPDRPSGSDADLIIIHRPAASERGNED